MIFFANIYRLIKLKEFFSKLNFSAHLGRKKNVEKTSPLLNLIKFH